LGLYSFQFTFLLLPPLLLNFLCVIFNMQMIPNSCYSTLHLILKVVLSTAAIFMSQKQVFFTMASLSTQTRHKSPTSHWRQSLSSLINIQVADTSVSLSDHVKLLGITPDKHLRLDKHISNVCSISYFHIRALRHIRSFIDLESSKFIACAIVSSRFDCQIHTDLESPPTISTDYS